MMYRTAVALVVLTALCNLAQAQQLRIYHIDVEQADATLLVAPSGHTLLIDSGKNGHGSRIKSLLDELGINRIDHFVATHYHEDHYGGIDELVADPAIEIGAAWDRGDTLYVSAAKRRQVRYRQYADSIGFRATHITRGMQIPLDDDVSVMCISSGGVGLTEEDPSHGHDENDMSVSFLIRMGSFRYFIGGDIHETTEKKIAALDQVLNVDVYRVNHHGAKTSSSKDFLEDMSPTVAIISNGDAGAYRHPQKVTLDALANLVPTCAVFQTNKYLHDDADAGNVADNRIGDPETSDHDGTILITVPVGGDTFEVSFRDLAEVFPIKGAAGGNVVIASLVPNPVGEDRELEEVTLRNVGASTVDLVGWRLEDAGGRIWSLVSLGDIGPGTSETILRAGMPMSLNNSGDTILLIDAADKVQDRFEYPSTREGVRLEAGL